MPRFPRKSRGKVRGAPVRVDQPERGSTPMDGDRSSEEVKTQKGVQLQHENFSCPICLELLTSPVTTPCGHNFCRDCIKTYWDGRTTSSCPQCRKTFTPRPELLKNTLLADLVEELEKTGLHDAPADHRYAGAEDVACDVCAGRKRKALKSCLVCLASYCEEHLQPHHKSHAFQKHKLVEPSKNLQQNICPCHDEVMKMFCRTDRQCICYLCSLDQHKDHDTVSAAAERTEKEKELELSLQQRLKSREKDVKVLDQQMMVVGASFDAAERATEARCKELMDLLQKQRSAIKQHLKSERETEVKRIKDDEKKIQQEIAELKVRRADLKKLSLTEDHTQFLLSCSSLSAVGPSTHSPSSITVCQIQKYMDEATASVQAAKCHLWEMLLETQAKVSLIKTQAHIFLPLGHPKTRAELLGYSQSITLDPNTAHRHVVLSEGNTRVVLTKENRPYPRHKDRFTEMYQVLSKESLNERSYWEVEWEGLLGVGVVVSYKNVGRNGTDDDCVFGSNDKSWKVLAMEHGCSLVHREVKHILSRGLSSRVGVYLNHGAGLLSFYAVVADAVTLLHVVQTTFTQPLYAGVGLILLGDKVHFCPLKKDT